MSRPRPTPTAEEPEPDGTEFDRPRDLETQAGGPREFAKLTEGSWSEGGSSQVLSPDPNA